jgi:hypothetical protein
METEQQEMRPAGPLAMQLSLGTNPNVNLRSRPNDVAIPLSCGQRLAVRDDYCISCNVATLWPRS